MSNGSARADGLDHRFVSVCVQLHALKQETRIQQISLIDVLTSDRSRAPLKD